jgi:DNA-binding transcriptional LysR family regulator
LDWNSLKIVLAIAEHGSLSGAAKALGINHSTVFRRLNMFEEQIAGRVFERLPHGYEPTALGEELIVHAKNIAASFDDLERHIVGQDIQPKGVVKITAPNNIAYRFLPRYMASFSKAYPEIRTEILASNLEFNMTNRQADIAVRATSSPPEHLVGRLLRKIKWSVYAAENIKGRSRLPRKLEELRNHRLIGATGMMRSLSAFVWMEKHLPEQIHMRCDDLVAMSYLSQAGHGLAVLPDDQQRPGIKKLFTFAPGETSELWILTHPDLRHVERIKLVMQHLTQAFMQDKSF